MSVILACILHHTDPAETMRGFYQLDTQPDLFGAWCFIRECGLIGRAGQVRTVPYTTATERTRPLPGSGNATSGRENRSREEQETICRCRVKLLVGVDHGRPTETL
jgi:predicted DNA-binding WGR domain protein